VTAGPVPIGHGRLRIPIEQHGAIVLEPHHLRNHERTGIVHTYLGTLWRTLPEQPGTWALGLWIPEARYLARGLLQAADEAEGNPR
jgi:hypothetical protein